MIMWIGGMQTLRLFWGAAIAQWILRRLPSCRPGFESLSHHVCFHQFIEFCNVEKTKINRKGSDIGPFFLKKTLSFSQMQMVTHCLTNKSRLTCRITGECVFKV